MKPTSDSNNNAPKTQAQDAQKIQGAPSHAPVPQHTTPSFAPSPTSDKEQRDTHVSTRQVHAPAGSLTLATFGEPHQSLTSPKAKKNN